MSDDPNRAGTDLRAVVGTVRELVGGLPGPIRRVRVAEQDFSLEVEWDPGPAATAPPVPSESRTPAVAAEPEGELVRSPLVGTFYRAPDQAAPPFVEVGDPVEVGQVVGIVEAMKLLNHITAAVAGTVTAVLVENGTAVQYDEPLLAVAPLGSAG